MTLWVLARRARRDIARHESPRPRCPTRAASSRCGTCSATAQGDGFAAQGDGQELLALVAACKGGGEGGKGGKGRAVKTEVAGKVKRCGAGRGRPGREEKVKREAPSPHVKREAPSPSALARPGAEARDAGAR